MGPIKEEGVVPKLFRRYPNLYGELSDAASALGRDNTRELLFEWRVTKRSVSKFLIRRS